MSEDDSKIDPNLVKELLRDYLNNLSDKALAAIRGYMKSQKNPLLEPITQAIEAEITTRGFYDTLTIDHAALDLFRDEVERRYPLIDHPASTSSDKGTDYSYPFDDPTGPLTR